MSDTPDDALIIVFTWALYADPTSIGGPPTLLSQALGVAIALLLGFIAPPLSVLLAKRRPA